jgi:hypothetical protein
MINLIDNFLILLYPLVVLLEIKNELSLHKSKFKLQYDSSGN